MIRYTRRALYQVDALIRHYEAHERLDAIRSLSAALFEAEDRIKNNPADGLPAPRPYPTLKRPGTAWIKAGRYWIAYRAGKPSLIIAVFFETADIPTRL